MVASPTPTIAEIKNKVSLDDIRALLSIAVCEVCDFFNVGKNMNNTQVALTVDLIIGQFGALKLEEIKYCFRRAMMRERLFDRLDGNIIIGWLIEYDAERTEAAVALSEAADALRLARASRPRADAIGFPEYLRILRRQADSGDTEARQRLAVIEQLQSTSAPQPDNAFFKWFHSQWLPSQNYKK